MIAISGNVPLKKIMMLIRTYPLLFGAVLGTLIVGAVFAVVIWFPWLGDDLGRHKRLVQAVYFTAAFFALLINRLWHWRRRGAFWASMCVLVLLHVIGVLFYTT